MIIKFNIFIKYKKYYNQSYFDRFIITIKFCLNFKAILDEVANI
ncbi:hypothetical protein SACC_30220 [Saccharolobus caldissimus]|uniref:Uncharacterized protein n=1 Tax=Saccharolobus caldissimus TaxID=1702097 RepID=A0AAQ4CW24_9CREN|nr:hypothetical protein SACC_30220 [Saccharolobus caldissimus]